MDKIMVVEDSRMMVEVIEDFVRKKDKDVRFIEAHNGQEAVDKYKTDRPDLIFMDIRMPVMDGMEALRRIHELDSDANIVMVTAVMDEEQEKRAKELGAKMYIIKPFKSEDIIDALKCLG